MVVTGELGRSFAHGFLFVANMLNTVTIDKIMVPDLVQTGNAATLDCQYTVLDDRFTLQWLFNGSEVYEWRPGAEPRVSGILEGQLDLNFRVSNISIHERRALRIAQLSPELSGEYTCRVISDAGAVATQLAPMLVFSPETEFVLDVRHEQDNSSTMNIRCIARGLFPQPDLAIEFNQSPVAQLQRVWRSGSLYSAESTAAVRARRGRAVCRLLLPAAGYAAMRSYCVPVSDTENMQSNAQTALKATYVITTTITLNILRF